MNAHRGAGSTLELRHPLARQPLRLGDLVGGHPLSDAVAVLGRHLVRLRCCEVEPHVGLDLVQGRALAFAVKDTEVELGAGITLRGRLPVPTQRLGVVLRHAPSNAIHEAEADLGEGVALHGRLPVPLRRLSVVLGHALTVAVHDTEVVLGTGVALFGQRSPLAQRRRVIATLIGRPALIPPRPHRWRTEGEQQDNSGGGKHLPHGGTIAPQLAP